MYAILLHDWELKRRPRRAWRRVLPETVPFNQKPRGGKGKSMVLTPDILDLLHALNPGEKEFRFVTGRKTGWVNKWKGNMPVAECLSMGGNIVYVEEVRGKFVRIASIDITEFIPDHYTHKNNPLLIHKFSCITKKDTKAKPSSGLDVYYPVLSWGELWVARDRVHLSRDWIEPDTA